MNEPLLYSFYGDDFTGSTDVLQQLASHGVPAVLFLRPPTQRDLERFAGVRAIGLAGDSRSRSPQWMDAHLPEIFAQLRAFGAPVNHYKVCSTFDSSPEIGSIGRAIEIGLKIFSETPYVPVVVAAPHLRRYVAFGNLFAAGPDGHIARIDRHPMSRHPVTPMREADLRRHLSLQTHLPIGSWDLTQLADDNAAPEPPQEKIVLLDGVDTRMQAHVGRLLWQTSREKPLFSASSSGLTAALVQAWQAEGLVDAPTHTGERLQERNPLLVISGSCSVATEQQIAYALRHNFDGVAVDAQALLSAERVTQYRDELVATAANIVRRGRSPILYTALGAPAEQLVHGSTLGEALGHVLRAVLERSSLRRVLLCGGDTCSHAVQQMQLTALTWRADVWPGAPLCRAHADDPAVDGLELVLKGGQVGDADLFARVLNAHRL